MFSFHIRFSMDDCIIAEASVDFNARVFVKNQVLIDFSSIWAGLLGFIKRIFAIEAGELLALVKILLAGFVSC